MKDNPLSRAIKDAIESPTVTELDVAEAIRDGAVGSPQRYENVWLFDVRITGTGVSYRTGLDEYVYRPPEDFLTDEFVARCNGLPLIFEHPKDSILDTDEYRERAIGTILLPYVKGDEVWGVAKVFDEDAAALMQTTHASTSPAVVFRNVDETASVALEDGETILIEGKPSYLDHLAICEEGVWDKGGGPKGVRLTTEDSAMADEEKMPAWADALCKRMDETCSRLDAMEKARDDEHLGFNGLEKKVEGEGYDKEAAEKIAGKVAAEKGETGRKDEAEEHGKEEEHDEHKAAAEIKAAEKEGDEERSEERKDSEEERMDADKREDARADAQAKENAALKRKIELMEGKLSRLVAPLSVEDRDSLAAAQSRADALAQMFGDSVSPPLHGERPIEYRKRLASRFQKYSDAVKSIKLDALDDAAFAVIEERIFADAQVAAKSPSVVPEGRLFEHKMQDGAGRTITKYTGDMNAWLSHFKDRPVRVQFADSATRRGVN